MVSRGLGRICRVLLSIAHGHLLIFIHERSSHFRVHILFECLRDKLPSKKQKARHPPKIKEMNLQIKKIWKITYYSSISPSTFLPDDPGPTHTLILL